MQTKVENKKDERLHRDNPSDIDEEWMKRSGKISCYQENSAITLPNAIEVHGLTLIRNRNQRHIQHDRNPCQGG